MIKYVAEKEAITVLLSVLLYTYETVHVFITCVSGFALFRASTSPAPCQQSPQTIVTFAPKSVINANERNKGISYKYVTNSEYL